MTNHVTLGASSTEDESFSVRYFGGQRYASNGMAVWMSGRIRMGLSDTVGMNDFKGVGVIETQLSSDDLKEAKDIHRQMCRAIAENPSTEPQWFGGYSGFSVRCLEQGQIVRRQGDLSRLPQDLSFRAKRFEKTVIYNYRNAERPLVKFDVAVNNVERRGHRFLVSINFINSGRYAVSMKSPDQWREGFPYRLSIGSTRTDGEGEWKADLAGLPLENKAEFSLEEIKMPGGGIDAYLNIPAGHSITLKFLAVPDGKVPRGTYRFSALVDAGLDSDIPYPTLGRVTFTSDPAKSATITFDRDYPSTPEEWNDYEARQRAKLSSQPVAPGQAFTEAGHYRLVSTSGQSSRFVFDFREGAVAPERKDEADEHGKPLRGQLSWLWEADLARKTIASPKEPCPREGRWIACDWQMSKCGTEQYRIFPKFAGTYQAGDVLPVVEDPPIIKGFDGVVYRYAIWKWVGA